MGIKDLSNGFPLTSNRKKKSSNFELLSLVQIGCDDSTSISFDLSKKKLLLGRCEHADIRIDHPQISYYHAFILIDENGSGKILDLNSENGIQINDDFVKESFFTAGDTLTLGAFQFSIEARSSTDQNVDFENQDQNVTLASTGAFVDSLQELDGDFDPSKFTLIDGEYCDLRFEDNGFNGLSVDPFYEMIDIHNDWDYLYDENKEEREIIDKELDGFSLSISTLAGDRLLSTEVYPLKRGTYHFSGQSKGKQKVHIDFLSKKEKYPVIGVVDEKVTINTFDNFSLRYLEVPLDADGDSEVPPPIFLKDFERTSAKGVERKKLVLDKGKVVILEKGSISILIKIVPTPPRLKFTPWLERDPKFLKQVGGFLSFGLLFLLMSFLIEKAPEPKEEVTIIYKRPDAFKKAPKIMAKAQQVKMDNKENLKPDKVKNQKTAAKKKSIPKKQRKIVKNQSAAKAKKQVVKVQKTIAKVQTYKFDMKSSVNQMLAKSGDLSKVKLKNVGKGSVKINNSKAGVTGSIQVQESNLNGTGGSLGKTGKFAAQSAMGAKGLVDSKGAFTSFIEAKTVVLGSIDPELLRKILRKYIPQFRHCYQQELEFYNDKLEGIVDLDFRIGGNGKVSKVKVLSKNGKFSNEGTNCMARVLTVINFPKPKGGGVVDVRQPLNFYSEK